MPSPGAVLRLIIVSTIVNVPLGACVTKGRARTAVYRLMNAQTGLYAMQFKIPVERVAGMQSVPIDGHVSAGLVLDLSFVSLPRIVQMGKCVIQRRAPVSTLVPATMIVPGDKSVGRDSSVKRMAVRWTRRH